LFRIDFKPGEEVSARLEAIDRNRASEHPYPLHPSGPPSPPDVQRTETLSEEALVIDAGLPAGCRYFG